MTDFKKGDKVTHRDDYTFPGVYTLQFDAVNTTVEVTDTSGKTYYFRVSNLTKVEEPGPKVGDRVRFVHEGVVTGTSGRDSGLALLIDGTAHLVNKGGTVEVLERAPKAYPVGTVVKTRIADAPLVKTRAGWRWCGEEKSNLYTTDAEVCAEIARSKDFEVIYEPASA